MEPSEVGESSSDLFLVVMVVVERGFGGVSITGTIGHLFSEEIRIVPVSGVVPS